MLLSDIKCQQGKPRTRPRQHHVERRAPFGNLHGSSGLSAIETIASTSPAAISVRCDLALPTDTMTPIRFTEHDARNAVRCALEGRDGWRYVETVHAKQRMVKREITTFRVRRILRSGRIEEGPAPGDRGGWKCTFVGTADDTVAVVVAFEFDEDRGTTLVVTAYRTGTR